MFGWFYITREIDITQIINTDEAKNIFITQIDTIRHYFHWFVLTVRQ